MPETTAEIDVHGTPPGEPPPCTRCYEEGHDAVWRFGQWQCPSEARLYMCEVCHTGTRGAYQSPSRNFVCDGCAEHPDRLVCSVNGCDATMAVRNSNFLPVEEGQQYCREHQSRCRYCRNFGATRVTYEITVCDACRHRLPQTCHYCDEPATTYRAGPYSGDTVTGVCDDETHDGMCDHCGITAHIDDLNDDVACFNCEQDSWSCDACGDVNYHAEPHHWDYGMYCGHCVRFCEGCGDYHPEPRCALVVNNWNYRPDLHFHPHYEPNRLYIGFELECEHDGDRIRHGGRADAAERVIEAAGGTDNPYLYLKEDGSLMDGFEMVSHPFDPEWALLPNSPFPWHAIAEAADAGMRSFTQPNCGLHMHLSRDAFGESHLWKFLQFHYRNPRALQAVALRSSVGYAKWNDERQLVMKYVKKESKNRDRYVAVNLQNDDTIELRYWKGTLKVESVQRAVKIAYGIYLYTKELTCQDVLEGGLKFGAFRKWAVKEWPDLFDFMKERTAEVQDVVQTRPAWPPRSVRYWTVGDEAYLDLTGPRGRYGIDMADHGARVTIHRVHQNYLDNPDTSIAPYEVRVDNRSRVWAVHPEMLMAVEPEQGGLVATDEGTACQSCIECCIDCRYDCEDGYCNSGDRDEPEDYDLEDDFEF